MHLSENASKLYFEMIFLKNTKKYGFVSPYLVIFLKPFNFHSLQQRGSGEAVFHQPTLGHPKGVGHLSKSVRFKEAQIC